jgi:hypothetical protein
VISSAAGKFPLELGIEGGRSMRTMLCLVGMVVALAAFGCGDSGVDEGTVPFKATDTNQFEDMKKQMIGNVKQKSYAKVPPPSTAPAEKAAP